MKWLDLHNWFHGEHCIVVGCGPSANAAREHYGKHWTMGCNRAVAFCQPDLATCVEPFRDRCWEAVRQVGVPIVFSHLCEDSTGHRPHRRIVQFPSKNVRSWWGMDGDLQCAMSPFWATAVCMWLGFSRIGLIGVDLTEDRYPDVHRENADWSAMESMHPDVKILNLSPTSRLTAIPQGTWNDIASKHFPRVEVPA